MAVADRATELVEVPLADLRTGDVDRGRPEIRNPRDDVPRELLVEVVVAGQTRLADERGAVIEILVHARNVPQVAVDADLLRGRSGDPDERVVRVALRDDRAAVEERGEERQRVGVVLTPARALGD